jgi:hypothetical protein
MLCIKMDETIFTLSFMLQIWFFEIQAKNLCKYYVFYAKIHLTN